jgi:hypothetical protein
MGHAKRRREQNANHAAFFVRVHDVVSPSECAMQNRETQKKVESQLRDGRSNADCADERRPHRAEDAQASYDNVLSERVRDEVDLMAEIGERANAVELAEWRSSRFEERLGRDHQNAHVML